MGFLLAHEDRIVRSDENIEENVFQVKGEMSNEWHYEDGRGRVVVWVAEVEVEVVKKVVLVVDSKDNVNL